GSRRKRRAGKARIRARVLWHVRGPRGLDRTEVIVAQTSALAERQAQIGELGLVPADADAEDEAAARGLIHGGRRLGRDERAPVRQDDYAGAQTHALGAPREIGEERERIGP